MNQTTRSHHHSNTRWFRLELLPGSKLCGAKLSYAGASMGTNCECPVAGYCQRHNRNKNAHLHALCQTRQDYFDSWERTPRKQRQLALGPVYNHWMPLHYYPVKHWDDWNEAAAKRWYRIWKRAIPKTGCGCSENWKKEVADLPPDFSSAKAFFAWTVEIHNAVSSRLGKQLQSIEDARAIWFG